MAQIKTSIGTQAAINVNITAVSGADPFTVTLAAGSASTKNGDTLTDEAAVPNIYLITAGAGTTSLTVSDSFGAGVAPSDAGSSQATTTRTHSTITDFEGLWDDTDLYAAADDAFGEGYDDSVFNETTTFTGGGTVGLNSTTLSVAVGERGDKTAGTGCRIERSTGGTIWDADTPAQDSTFEHWELTTTVSSSSNGTMCRPQAGATHAQTWRNIMMHDYTKSAGASTMSFLVSNGTFTIENSFFYALTTATGSNAIILAVGNNAFGGIVKIFNSTIHNTNADGSTSSNCFGIASLADSSNKTYKNVLVTDTKAAGTSGTVKDYNFGGTNINSETNISSDDTADDAGGSGHLINQTSSSIYISTTLGAENLHLQAGSPAIDVGTDLTSDGITDDIDGDARPQGVAHDIGGDELVPAVAVADDGGGPKLLLKIM